MIRSYILSICLTSILFVNELGAQDVHFSHIHASPVALNPSMAGLSNGDFRVIANYKNQWRSTNTNFNTAQISMDGTVNQIKKNASFNLGLILLTDVAGDLNYRQTSLQVPMSIIMALDKNGNHNISMGMQHGFFHHSADLSKIEAFDQEPLVASLFSTNRFMYDLSLGYTWFSVIDGKSSFYVGNSFNHINTPNVNTSPSSGVDNMYMRTNIMAGAELVFKKNKQAFLPSLLSMIQGPHRETTIGSFYRYRLSEKSAKDYSALLFGVWTRWYASPKYNSGFDSLITTVRYDRKKVSYSLSYDFTLSTYAIANKARGGVELSLTYIGQSKSKKRPNKTVHCPAW